MREDGKSDGVGCCVFEEKLHQITWRGSGQFQPDSLTEITQQLGEVVDADLRL